MAMPRHGLCGPQFQGMSALRRLFLLLRHGIALTEKARKAAEKALSGSGEGGEDFAGLDRRRVHRPSAGRRAPGHLVPSFNDILKG